MDEATASLDPESDHMAHQAIKTVFMGKHSSAWTTMTIAHRLTTALESDRIIVMSDGYIVEDGTPNDLLVKENGFFKNLMKTENK